MRGGDGLSGAGMKVMPVPLFLPAMIQHTKTQTPDSRQNKAPEKRTGALDGR
jgi:hypothetical protein